MTGATTITFGDTVRGCGKVFTEVQVKGFVPAELTARGWIGEDVRSPAQLIRKDQTSWVLVVPVLAAAQRVRLEAFDENGTPSGSAETVIKAFQARMKSSMNTLRKNEPALKIRNFDLAHADWLPWFRVSYLVPDGDHEIIYGCLRFKASHRSEELFANVDVQVLSPAGERVGEPWVNQGESCKVDPDTHVWVREIDFTVRIPAGLRSFVIACYRDVPTALDGIHVREPHQVDMDRRFFADVAVSSDTDPAYHEWFIHRRRASKRTLALQRASAKDFGLRPKFSIVVPLYHTPKVFLDDLIDSVVNQTYDNWELVLVNASPEDETLRENVDNVCEMDSRIRLIELEDNYGITVNTNYGIEAAKGDFICFADHDDVLEYDALYWYADAVNKHPDTDLIYCDEDNLLDGRYIHPFFKPDWDLDRLCYENYVCHMLCVRKALIDGLDELPGPEFDGSQDHNMTLLAGERARNVFHVRRVLYHWRVHENSTAQGGAEQKEGTLDAEKLAIEQHLQRVGIKGTCEIGKRMRWRCDIAYEFDQEPLVSIVIPNKDGIDMLRPLIESIDKLTRWQNYEIVIAENNSEEPETFAYYRQIQDSNPRVRVIEVETDGVFNFAHVINAGFDAAKGDYLLMLNNDMELLDGEWLHHMVGICQREDVGAVGAKLLYKNGCIQHIGVAAGQALAPNHFNIHMPDSFGCNEFNQAPHRMLATTGACLMTRRSVFEKVGRMDESLAVDYNDVDFCMRLVEAGYAVVVEPRVRLLHFESVTRGGKNTDAKRAQYAHELGMYVSRWGSVLLHDDPYYGPSFKWNTFYFALDWNGNDIWPAALSFRP